jgi:hypothetical protein
MRRISSALLILLLGVSAAIAAGKKEKEDDKTRIFNADYDKVWEAAVASANENFVIEHSEKESGILNFHSGISLTGNGFRCGVLITKLEDGRVRVQLNTQKKAQIFAWGAGGRIAEKFFKGMTRYLEEGKAKV